MKRITAPPRVPATVTAPELVLRPWRSADTTALVDLHRDDVLRRWISSVVDDEADAGRWVRRQQRGWEAGERFASLPRRARSATGPPPTPAAAEWLPGPCGR